MSVMNSKREEEVIEAANDVKYGLAGYVWTNDIKRGHRVAQAVDAGMLWINSQNVRDLRIPFGGTKIEWNRKGRRPLCHFEFYTETQVIHVAIGDHRIPQFGKVQIIS